MQTLASRPNSITHIHELQNFHAVGTTGRLHFTGYACNKHLVNFVAPVRKSTSRGGVRCMQSDNEC